MVPANLSRSVEAAADELREAEPERGVRLHIEPALEAEADGARQRGFGVATRLRRVARPAEAFVAERWAADALHVALATVAGCAMIVSWNFKHIVSFELAYWQARAKELLPTTQPAAHHAAVVREGLFHKQGCQCE